MNKKFSSIVISTPIILVPLLAGISWAKGWFIGISILFTIWTIVQWVLMSVLVQMVYENEEEDV